MRTCIALGSLLLMVACSQVDSADDTAPIQGGSVDKRDPAIGLVWFQGGGFCSGTLIAPDVVLTAGHCVQHPVEAFYLGTGTPTSQVTATPPTGMERHAVAAQVAHPSFAGVYACPISGFDVALLKLAAPVAKVTPRALAKGAPLKGTLCSAVGFGTHNVDAAHVEYEQKRRASETVASTTASAIEVSKGTGIVDHGDSGGPLICGGSIAGVTSCGNDLSPAHTSAWYARVDGASSWIAATVAGWKSGASPKTSCDHGLCAPGSALVPSCDPCVKQVCDGDAYCCQTAWDATCISEAGMYCGLCK